MSSDVVERPAGVGDQSPRPRPDEVLAVVAAVRAEAERDGQSVLVESLDVERAVAATSVATVVVAGETSRGKSSTLNALVERRILPEDADIASCVRAVVRRGPAPRAQVWFDSGATDVIELDRAAEFASLDPGTHLPRHEAVTRVEIELPVQRLPTGLELIDTPGVGGLVAGHGALTLATLERVDALLFVVDAGSEITESELTFLRRATERIHTVAFVLTKIDLYPDWRAVQARTLQLLRQHAPAFADAPWFPVDNRAAIAAAAAEAAGRHDSAHRRRAASGHDALEAYLEGLAANIDGLRLANLLATSRRAIERLVGLQREQADAIAGSPEFSAQKNKEKAALAALQARGATWRQTLSERVQRLDQRLRIELNRRVEDIRKETGDQIAAGGAKVLSEIVNDLPPRAEATWLELDTLLRRELPGIVAALGEALGNELASNGAAQALGDLSWVAPTVPERLQKLPEASHGKPGTSLAEFGVLSASLGLTIFHLVPVIGVVLGPAVVGVFTYRRYQKEKSARSREDARRYLNDVCTRLTNEVPPAMSAALATAKDAVVARVTEAVDQEKRRLAASLAECDRALAAERSEREQRTAAVRKRLASLSDLREDAVRLDERLAIRQGSFG